MAWKFFRKVTSRKACNNTSYTRLWKPQFGQRRVIRSGIRDACYYSKRRTSMRGMPSIALVLFLCLLPRSRKRLKADFEIKTPSRAIFPGLVPFVSSPLSQRQLKPAFHRQFGAVHRSFRFVLCPQSIAGAALILFIPLRNLQFSFGRRSAAEINCDF